jgi:hypothetical protein
MASQSNNKHAKELKRLFVPDERRIGDTDYSCEKVVVVSTADKALAYACYTGSGKRLLIGVDPTHNRLEPLSLSSIPFILEILTALEDDLASALEEMVNSQQNRVRELNGTVLLETKNNVWVLCTDSRERAGLNGIVVQRSDGVRLPYAYASITSDRLTSSANLFLDQNCIKACAGSPLRDLYQVVWDDDLGTREEVNGSFVRGQTSSDGVRIEVNSFILESMSNRRVNDLVMHGLSPQEMITYLIMSTDNGALGIVVNDETDDARRESLYFAVVELHGISLHDTQVRIGDVHFAREVDTPEEYLSICDKRDDSCFAWTNERAESFVDAQSKALERITRATEIAAFFTRSDRLPDAPAKVAAHGGWDIRKHRKKIVVTDRLYIENCDTGSYVLNGGGNSVEQEAVRLDSSHASRANSVNCIELLPSSFSSLSHPLLNAIRWIIKADEERSVEDKVVSLNTALEFCVKGELGKTVLEEALLDVGAESFDKELVERFWSSSLKMLDLRVPGLSEGDARKVEKRLLGQLKSSVNSSRLASRLGCMVERLGNPITPSELELLYAVNKTRNGILHARKNNNSLSSADMDRAIAAASTLVLAKIDEIGPDNERD